VPLRPKWRAHHYAAVRIIGPRTLREFVESKAGHKDQAALKASLNAWFNEVRKANWRSTADVKRLYASAEYRVGRAHCLQTSRETTTRRVSRLREHIVWIKWIGAHKQYDRISAKEVKRGAP